MRTGTPCWCDGARPLPTYLVMVPNVTHSQNYALMTGCTEACVLSRDLLSRAAQVTWDTAGMHVRLDASTELN